VLALSVDAAPERLVDVVPVHAQRDGHAIPAVEGRPVAVGRDRQQHQDRRRVRSDLGEPAVMQEPGLEPAEWTARSPFEVRPRRSRRWPPRC
jgi:hypothetical protein